MQLEFFTADSSADGTKYRVARIGNLPLRRIDFVRTWNVRRWLKQRKPCGLQIRDAAEYNPAPRVENFCPAPRCDVARGIEI